LISKQKNPEKILWSENLFFLSRVFEKNPKNFSKFKKLHFFIFIFLQAILALYKRTGREGFAESLLKLKIDWNFTNL